MPKTFRDAILITAKLGILYLWIDSLCIVQDSARDWETESGRMGAVYNGAYLTLAATRASADVDGFLSTRDVPYYYPIDLQCPIGMNDSFSNLRFNAVAHKSWPLATKTHIEPLMKRAWCLQERLLAVRTLSFGGQQNFFECHKEKLFENGEPEPWSLPNYSLQSIYPNIDDRHQTVDFNPWYRWIEEFSVRGLTQLSDRLPAISGLAHRVSEYLVTHLKHRITQPQYCAGIWGDDLLNGLLWNGFNKPRSRPTEYYAPSWSWAAIKTDTAFPMIMEEERHRLSDDDGSGTMGVPRHFQGTAKPISQLHFTEFSTTAKGSDPFGQVSDGYIDLKAPLIELLKDPKNEWFSSAFIWNYNAKNIASVDCDYDLALDTPPFRLSPPNPVSATSSPPDPKSWQYYNQPWWIRYQKEDTIFGLLLACKPDYGGLLVEKVSSEDVEIWGSQRRSLVTVESDVMLLRRVGVFSLPKYLNRELFWHPENEEVLKKLEVRKVRIV